MKRFWDRCLTNPRWWAAVPLVILLMAYSLVMLIPALIADLAVLITKAIQFILAFICNFSYVIILRLGQWTYGNLKD